MFVQCKECGEKHESDEVEAENIEEDFAGRDLLTYICPETGNSTKSLVFAQR